MNHYPVVRRGQVPRSCSNQSGTADPFAAVTCPDCRERLQFKVDADKAESVRHKPESQTAVFHAGVARHYENMLAQ